MIAAAFHRGEGEPLRRDVERLPSRYRGRPRGELQVCALPDDAFGVMRKHHLHLPADLALLLKALVMIEGAGGPFHVLRDLWARRNHEENRERNHDAARLRRRPEMIEQRAGAERGTRP